jgi:hypothetical protein
MGEWKRWGAPSGNAGRPVRCGLTCPHCGVDRVNQFSDGEQEWTCLDCGATDERGPLERPEPLPHFRGTHSREEHDALRREHAKLLEAHIELGQALIVQRAATRAIGIGVGGLLVFTLLRWLR